MISEKFFVRSYNEAWNLLLPMGDALIRRMNVDTERFAKEISAAGNAQLRGLINEFGFELARVTYEAKLSSTTDIPEEVQRACMDRSIARIAKMERQNRSVISALPEFERREAHSVALSVLRFVKYLPSSGLVSFAPSFPGCGLVDACAGDLIHGKVLCEMKAGDRSFRLVDLRQLLTYATLNKLSGTASITHLALVNPRRGVVYQDTFDGIAWAASGRSASDLSNSIADVMSGAGSSR